ncbi:hypothetical protein ASPZODRAFT_133370 [Penicilliopsis zonata CBS 506.65]|uniref:Methyltransferase domain-containing protein n=1 Tax=Penicilliopsis zonata CBS 506.65 TaxID=1073090 RepID=A0A1L9SE91_9EURO|nr:hypothetical protein ASPZODRAFT_133370 [Penicilliopsis zonata CBS 506.65]OJJ45545.1 hypothetical protein ASPZODRAFT_133370 [Penicilliopsis zonata CBS 506.65]
MDVVGITFGAAVHMMQPPMEMQLLYRRAMARREPNFPSLVHRKDRVYFKQGITTFYPLPCDLLEIHRRILRCMLYINVFGGPICAPISAHRSPKRVLEISLAAGFWSSQCRDWLNSHNVSFHGLDLLPQTPEWSQLGMNWHVTRHNLQKSPTLPFEDASFDFVFIRDLGLYAPTAIAASLANMTTRSIPSTSASFSSSSSLSSIASSTTSSPVLTEAMRVLCLGGILEVWDSDWVFRSLLPPMPEERSGDAERGKKYTQSRKKELQIAGQTATYASMPTARFTNPGNRFIKEYNSWAQKAFEKQGVTTQPSTQIQAFFFRDKEEADRQFVRVGTRRMAIPLGELPWENGRGLTAKQWAIRHSALLTVVQMIEAMEPLLMEASGMNEDEFGSWAGAMSGDLLQNRVWKTAECLEMSAWWGEKR